MGDDGRKGGLVLVQRYGLLPAQGCVGAGLGAGTWYRHGGVDWSECGCMDWHRCECKGQIVKTPILTVCLILPS